MKQTTLLKVLLLFCTMSAGAQLNSITPRGWLERSEKLLSVGNYAACLDQLAALDGASLTAEEKESAAWLRCRAAYESGDSRAEHYLAEFTKSYPTSGHRNEAMLFWANSLFNSDVAVAEQLRMYEMVDASLLSDELAADYNFHVAACLLWEGGRIDEAKQRFETLLGDKKFGKISNACLGYIAYLEKDYDEAKRIFESLDRKTIDENHLDIYLAHVYYATGDYDKAIKCAEAIIKGRGSDKKLLGEAYRVAGESYFAQVRTAKAIEYLEKYIKIEPNPEKSALYILGISEYNKSNYELAKEYLEPVTKENNAMAQSAYLYIGEALMKLGDVDAALLAFNSARAWTFDPKVQEAAYYNYAVAKFSGANMPFDSSVSTLEEFLNSYPDGTYAAAVQEYIVSGYLRDQNYESALASINRMARPGEKILVAKQQILYAQGNRALSTGNYDSALDYLKQADRLNYSPEIGYQTKLSLGETYYKLGNYPEAIKAINAYIKAAPANDVNRPLAYYDLGYTYFASKNYAKAAESFETMVKKPGKLSIDVTTDALNRIADTYFYREQFDKAAKYYSRAYDELPSVGDYPLFQQGVIQGFQRKYEAKIATLTNLLKNFPTSSLVPDAMLEMTEGYLRLNETDKAINTYRRLVAEHPTTEQGRRGYIELAMTLKNSGDRQGAIDAYKKVISLYPTSDEAALAVEEMQRIAAEDGTLGEFSSFLASVESAPKLDVNEADRLTFEMAEQEYIEKQKTARLERYVAEYPEGAYRSNAYLMLMEAAEKSGDEKQTLAYADVLIKDYPDKRAAENALLVKAKILQSLGEGEAALAAWRALEARASDAAMLNTARVGIMRIARELGDNESVLAATEALLASSTLGSEARNEAIFSRAFAHSLTDNISAAQEGWAQIADKTDDLYGAKSAYYLAESYFNQNNYAEARKHTDALIGSATPHAYWLARAFILLSDILAAEDKKFEAREYLISLKENYPGTETDIFIMIDQRLSNL